LFRTKVVDKVKTHLMFNNSLSFSSKIVPFMR